MPAIKKYKTKQDYVNKAIDVNGNYYNYDKVDWNIKSKLTEKIIIGCPVHGYFEQRASAHLLGQGCKKCAYDSRKSSTPVFVEKAIKIHGNKYTYPRTVYVHSEEPVIITCPIHGDFKQLPSTHLTGSGCNKCGEKSARIKASSTTQIFVEKSIKIHGNKYTYPRTVYVHSEEPVIITCPIHGDFEQAPMNHLSGKGCRKCSTKKNADKARLDINELIKRSMLIYGEDISCHKVEYVSINHPVNFYCCVEDEDGLVHGDFWQTPGNFLSSRGGCSKCKGLIGKSKPEVDLSEFISNYYRCVENDRTILYDKELDIYIPEKKIAIEYNGLYWHNELNKSEKYHLQKTEECLSKGIRLIHIFEDEWIYKQDIVKSRIRNIIGVTKNHYYGRKCVLKNISKSESNQFLEANHIQGKGSNSSSSVQIGLYYENKLVSLMTFGSLRKNLGSEPKEGHYELIRFCNLLDTNVVGGASKLLSYFIRTYRPKNIISYCDRRWSEGNLYEKLGFTFSHNSQPNYWYIFGQRRANRFSYRKDILVSKHGCPEITKEKDFCFSKKWYRIYDCGTKVYTLNCTQKE